MALDLLVRNVRIDDDRPLVDLAIEAGRFVEIAPALERAATTTIDAAGRAAIPAFVEAHLHLDKALLHRRLPARVGTLEEAIRVTAILKGKQTRADVLDRSRRVLDMALTHGTLTIRAHPDVDLIQGLIGVETLLSLRDEYAGMIDLQIVAFPQEGILKSEGTFGLMEEAMQMGADVVGGCPYSELTWQDSRTHIDMLFELAQKHDADLDIHADFSDDMTDRRFMATAYIAECALAHGYRGRVSLGHATNLGNLDAAALAPIVEGLLRADISIVTLPATDLYLGGRHDAVKPRRGLAPVRALHEAGVNVAYASNNIRNAFTPFGNADMLLMGNLLAHVVQFGTPEHQRAILDMGTHNAARAVGIAEDYGIAVGKFADLLIVDTRQVADALLDIPVRSWVIKRGRIVVENRVETIVHRR
ncbi:MAG TPA: amidohydrolase family protein [Polyangiales bacterium]|jgi:cytosine deaminase